MEIEISKTVMSWIMPIFDVLVALLFFYMALSLTRDFGLGSRRQVLLLVHRVLLFCCSLAFAYHAYDIWLDPVRHGLTFSNFQLHAFLVAIAIVSTLRLVIAERPNYPGGNGSEFFGPFRRRK